MPQRQPEAGQARALTNWSHRDTFPTGEAVEFLRATIRANPGEVTLLGIAPMTNIGLLFALDPEIPHLLKQLVLMNGHFAMQAGGTVGYGPVEWNSGGDPHATAIVYNAHVPVHRSVGIEVTTRVTMNAAQVKQRFQSKLLSPVLDFAGVWFEHTDRMTFHDPLAAATIFDNEICRYESGVVSVELASHQLDGFTHWLAGCDASRHEIAVDVDVERFFDHYFSIVR